MNYKALLEKDEKLIFVTRLHLYLMIYPIVFTGVFGIIFTYGGILTRDFVLLCQIMALALLIYPLIIAIMIINTRYIVTDKRVIEQTGLLNKRHNFIPIGDIIDLASSQTDLRKLIRCGDVRIKFKKGNGVDYRIFRYMFAPHEFIVHLQELLDKK